jgi:hypothetical protein
MAINDENTAAPADFRGDGWQRDVNRPDVTLTPPLELLATHAPDVAALVRERDAAHDAYEDFIADHDDILSEAWERIAAAADKAAGAEAVRAGRDPLKLASQVEKVRALRPRMVGAANELAQQVNSADRKVRAAMRAAAASLAPVFGADVADTEAAYTEAHSALQRAREAYGKALARRKWSYVAAADGRHDFPTYVAAPAGFDGLRVEAGAGIPEIRAIRDSWERAGVELTPEGPEVRSSGRVMVRGASGAEVELTREQAVAMGRRMEIIRDVA